jgi:hypothetical protein
MKVLYYLMILLTATVASCCFYPVEDILIDIKTKNYRTNIVGITGDPSVEPYIEIQYSEADAMRGNVTKSIMVSPPYIFENRNVNIVYDSIIWRAKYNLGYYLVLKHDYEEGGAEYFRIINHSTDKPIEFFIAGTQDVVLNGDGSTNEVQIIPSVYYRRAPVYYLLFPDKKYHKDVLLYGEPLRFTGNHCGDIELTAAWSINDVMQLYRAEQRKSADTVLYVDMRAEFFDGGRMSNPPKYNKTRLKDRTFYGLIPPKGQLKSDEKIWLLATPWIFEEYIESKRF